MKFRTGDIITTTAARPASGLFQHKGVLIEDPDEGYLIAHNTPSETNDFGGNVIIEPLEDFIAPGRMVLKVKKTNLTKNDILKSTHAMRRRKFSASSFNCEHYVSCVLTKRKMKYSGQMALWIGVFFGVFVASELMRSRSS